MYKKMVPADVYARRIVFGRAAYGAHSMMRQNHIDASEVLNRRPQGNAVNPYKQRTDLFPRRRKASLTIK
jgi:hypothetical protein